MYKLWKRTFAFCVDAFLLTGLFVIAVYLLDSLFNMAPVYNLFSFSGGAGQGSLSVSLRGFFEAEKSAFVYLYYLAIILVLFLAYEYFFQHSVLSAHPEIPFPPAGRLSGENSMEPFNPRLAQVPVLHNCFGVALSFSSCISIKNGVRFTILWPARRFAPGSQEQRVLPKRVGWFF